MTENDYSTVTELAGDEITREQLERLCHRYFWSGTYCDGKDVIEVACGTGPGLGYLADRAKSLRAGDYSPSILAITQRYYDERVELVQFDAQTMPYEDQSADVVILFEAIYYVPDATRFVRECKRVLRPGGRVLIATANKDLYDFTPSPYSHVYYGTVELNRLFENQGFTIECFGYLSVQKASFLQRCLRPVKKLAVDLDLMPKTMAGKKWLKRVVFGKMVAMPFEIEGRLISFQEPSALSVTQPDHTHKVIYCAATLPT
jgi:ubiquinone/menaquinone biosynthesis C-methylase UbiE